MDNFILNFTGSASDLGILEVIKKMQQKQSCIFFTSGTTGEPKKIQVDYSVLERGTKVKSEYKNSVWGLTYDYQKIAGYQIILHCLLNQCSMVNLIGKTKSETEYLINQKRVTHLSATPTFYRLLIDGNRFENVTQVTFGGETVDEVLFSKIKNAFPNANITNIYALTEYGTLLTSHNHYFELNDKTSKYIRIIDNFIHVGIDGNFTNTGDMVECISNTRFKIVGRDSNMINVGGVKVNPTKIENIINELEYVSNCRVYGRKNSVLGNLVQADLMLKRDVNIKDIKNDLSRLIKSKYEIPAKINIVDEISLNSNNKISRQ